MSYVTMCHLYFCLPNFTYVCHDHRRGMVLNLFPALYILIVNNHMESANHKGMKLYFLLAFRSTYDGQSNHKNWAYQ